MCSDPEAPNHEAALELWRQGYRRQSGRDVAGADRLYRASIDLHPTAEAWTFLGWLASWQGELELAVGHCRQAIAVDPTLGNPYNDIGVYLIELGRLEEAINWLLQAIDAPRYEARHFPHLNLGRIYEQLGRVHDAVAAYRESLRLEPGNAQALAALERLAPQRNGQVSRG